MSDVFICYSSKDRGLASRLCARLEAQGWSVFMDLDIDAGESWSEEIERELADAKAVLTLWSSNSVRSRFAMDEAHEAADRGVIFPVRIDDVPIPYGFRKFQTPALTGWDGDDDGEPDEWKRLLGRLRKHLEGANASEAQPSTPGLTSPVPAHRVPPDNAVQDLSAPLSRRRKRSPRKSGSKPLSASGVTESAASPVDGPAVALTCRPATESSPVYQSPDRSAAAPTGKGNVDKLGDPPPAVGVIELDVPVDEDAPSGPIRPKRKQRQSRADPDVERLLKEIDDPDTPPPRRLEIGNRLDELGDRRRGVGLNADGLPDIAWVKIPGGPFIYQDGERRELPDFWIARYPITNAQFQSFVEAAADRQHPGLFEMAREMLNAVTGRHESGWRDLERPRPVAAPWPQGNRPRTNVSWYEAVAFTRWLTDRMGLSEETIRLPTEVEWEKAARGVNGLIYPWGSEYRSGCANVIELGKDAPWPLQQAIAAGPYPRSYTPPPITVALQQAIAVGLYPHGQSPYGVEDLCGNVWEWCLNKYEAPQVTAPDASSDARVWRGASWMAFPFNARAVDHEKAFPGNRGYRCGFRVMSSVPMPDS